MKSLLSVRSMLLTGACLVWFSPALAQDDPQSSAPIAVEESEARQETVVVRGMFIPDEKRSTSEVSSLIDSGDFSLQGDGDAAAALARVAGIATAEDEFIYVRGLNERYSTALLNGSPLPSPAPLRRVVPLNLFPTSALQSVLVQKTYSPNLPGEFGGGLVDLRTKTVPDEGFFTIGAKAGYDSDISLEDGLLYDGADTDIFGIDDGTRDRPSLANGLDNEFGRQLTDNSSLLVMQKGEVAPNFSFDLSGGNSFDVSPDIVMGFIGAAGYSNSWKSKIGQRGFGTLEGDGLGVAYNQLRQSTENTIEANGLATVGFKLFSDHEIKFTGLLTRSTEKKARIITGENNESVDQRVDALEWFEHQLWSTQVQGVHFFPQLMDLKLEWRGSYSEALRDAPYQLSNIYNINDAGVPILSVSSASNRMQFSRVDDDTTDFGFDATLPLSRSGTCTYFCEADLKFGYSYVENDRSATSIIYDINGVQNADRTNRLDYIYNYLFQNGLGQITEVAGEQFPQYYVATLEIDAAYAGIDAQLTPYIRAALGVRYEDAIQAVDTQDIGGDLTGNVVEGVIDQSDWLPAATITWNPIEDLQVRAGYSETLTRPQFRELAPAVFVNTETDTNFFGNPYLVNASIKNYDLRGEYYFGRDQFVTLGLFYKDLTNPIEEILEPAETVQTTFINVPSAELYGFEVEYEQILPVHEWLKWGFFEDRDFQIKTNYTWSDSEIHADGDVAFNIGTNLNPVRGTVLAAGRINDGRRMQGQSEHLFNMQLGLLNESAQSEINILVNYVSERIRSGEQSNLPAIMEQPPTTVDLVWNKTFEAGTGEYQFSLNVQNIFQEGYEAYQERGDDRVYVDTYGQGMIVSVGLKRMF